MGCQTSHMLTKRTLFVDHCKKICLHDIMPSSTCDIFSEMSSAPLDMLLLAATILQERRNVLVDSLNCYFEHHNISSMTLLSTVAVILNDLPH